METSPILLRFRLVEHESMNDIMQWSLLHMSRGADYIIDGPLHIQYVIIPESLLYEFLTHYGWAVSSDSL
jgi:hypothetical protein